MGVYYKLVNWKTKQRIEPGDLGEGGIKEYAIVHGVTAKLLADLHVRGETDWQVLSDAGELYHLSEYEKDPEAIDPETAEPNPYYLEDVTEEARQAFNRRWPKNQIERFDGPKCDAQTPPPERK